MVRNTGELYLEKQKIEFLEKCGINFLESDIERTLTYLQIPTTYTNQDLDRLIKLVAPIDGEVKLIDDVAWIYLKHDEARPLWQQGAVYYFLSFSYLYTLANLDNFILWVLTTYYNEEL